MRHVMKSLLAQFDIAMAVEGVHGDWEYESWGVAVVFEELWAYR